VAATRASAAFVLELAFWTMVIVVGAAYGINWWKTRRES
jgi:hypothetical protein